jgi:hypothetical protein
MKQRLVAAVALAAAMSGAPAMAHHSYAMFDMAKKVTLEGVVREWQWGNPHIFLELNVREASGTNTYSLEAGSPSMTRKRLGWSHDMLKPGDKVTVVVSPLKDGRRGGSLVSVSKDGVLLDGNQPGRTAG